MCRDSKVAAVGSLCEGCEPATVMSGLRLVLGIWVWPAKQIKGVLVVRVHRVHCEMSGTGCAYLSGTLTFVRQRSSMQGRFPSSRLNTLNVDLGKLTNFSHCLLPSRIACFLRNGHASCVQYTCNDIELVGTPPSNAQDVPQLCRDTVTTSNILLVMSFVNNLPFPL